ncbi:MAG: hypothetical protein HOP10_08955 [Chitinophagaceae bacterium]|nr:hypothetical protein [Chitinophagaceae bacterium]
MSYVFLRLADKLLLLFAASLLPGVFKLKRQLMKRIPSLKALIAVIAICSISKTYSQDHKYEFGLNLGFTVYQGDLTPEKFGAFKTQKFAVGLHVSRILNQTFSIRGNLLISTLRGDDAVYAQPEYRRLRNFNFTSPVVELSCLLVFNITAQNYADKGLSPYVFAGGGLAYLNIKRDWSRLNRDYFNAQNHILADGLAIDSAHSLPRIIPVIPVGGGLRYFFSPQWGLNAEASYRLGYTDYIDGFSQAANPELKDHYLNYAIGIIYRPGKKNKLGCPVMKY